MTTKLTPPKTPSTKPTAPGTKQTPMAKPVRPDKIVKEKVRTY